MKNWRGTGKLGTNWLRKLKPQWAVKPMEEDENNSMVKYVLGSMAVSLPRRLPTFVTHVFVTAFIQPAFLS